MILPCSNADVAVSHVIVTGATRHQFHRVLKAIATRTVGHLIPEAGPARAFLPVRERGPTCHRAPLIAERNWWFAGTVPVIYHGEPSTTVAPHQIEGRRLFVVWGPDLPTGPGRLTDASATGRPGRCRRAPRPPQNRSGYDPGLVSRIKAPSFQTIGASMPGYLSRFVRTRKLPSATGALQLATKIQ